MRKLIALLLLSLFAFAAQAQTTVTLVPNGPIVNGAWASTCYAGECRNVPNSEGSAITVRYALPASWDTAGSLVLVYNGAVYSTTAAGQYTLTPFYNGQYVTFNKVTLLHASGASVVLSLTIYDHFATCGGRGSARTCNAQRVYSGAITR